MRRLLFALLACCFVAVSIAAPLSPVTRTEIDGLLSRLETSACEFNRNGTWHAATQAKTHLLQKLKYLEDRGMVQSAEQFIERAASQSSFSGEAYLVRCANAAPAPSREWLLTQLQLMRKAAGGKTAP